MSHPSDPTVKLTLRGLVLLFADHGDERGVVGIPQLPRNAPPHELTIDVTRTHGTGAPQVLKQFRSHDIHSPFSLSVTDTSETGIRLFTRPDFNRHLDTGDPHDFRWAVNFEGEIYPDSVEVNKDRFSAFLTLDNALFFTERKSVDKLETAVGPSSDFSERGKVAVSIGAHIYLDQEGSKAVFKHGDEIIFKSEPGMLYAINISQSRPDHDHDHVHGHVTDAELYYYAIGGNIHDEDKIHFRCHGGPPRIDPHAACFVGEMGKTKP